MQIKNSDPSKSNISTLAHNDEIICRYCCQGEGHSIIALARLTLVRMPAAPMSGSTPVRMPAAPVTAVIPVFF